MMLHFRFIINLYFALFINFVHSYPDTILNIEGYPEIAYSIPITLGKPPQLLNVVLDTGSSNFAIAGIKISDDIAFFDKSRSSSFNSTGIHVSEEYFNGSWSGIIGKEFFSFEHFNHIFPVYVSLMEQVSPGFFVGKWSGILGLAYPALARPDQSITPVYNSLVKELNFPNVFAIKLCSPHINTSRDGEIMPLGGSFSIGNGLDLIDMNFRSQGYMYVDIIEDSFYKVLITSISVSGSELGLPCSVYNNKYTIVDSGTTDFVFNTETYNSLIQMLKKNTKVLYSGIRPPTNFWNGQLNLNLNISHDFKMFPTFVISLQSPNSLKQLSISIPPQLYLKLVPRINCISSNANECFRIGISSGSIATILGIMLFKGYAIQFNRQLNQIGFQITSCNVYEGGKERLNLHLSPQSNENCVYSEVGNNNWVVWVIVSGIVSFLLCILFVAILLLRKHKCSKNSNVSNVNVNNTAINEDLEGYSESSNLVDSDDDLLQ